MTRRIIITARILLVLYLIAMGVLLFLPLVKAPGVKIPFLDIPVDKLEHFILFFPYVFLVYCSFHSLFRTRSKALFLFLVILSGIAVGGATEVVQSLIPERQSDLYDFISDAISVLVSGIVLCLKVRKR